MSVRLSFFGAAGCVTGACMLLETGAARALVDCGLFQGPKTLKALNYGPLPFEAADIDAVLLTHAHIDHSGLLPKLMLAGFTRAIYATTGTRELCDVLLPDAGAIQEMEVEALNARNLRHGKTPVAPMFTKRDAIACLDQFSPVDFKCWIDVAPGVRARWWNAGHILGAASIEVEVQESGQTQTLIFSGDIGPGDRRFEDDPEGPSGVDHVILETTYGDRERPAVDASARKQALAEEVMQAHAAGGPLLIPAFAVERTQELIVDLLELMEGNAAPPAPIFLDSPLAVRASEVFLRQGEGFQSLRESRWLKFTERVDESRAIERVSGWHIIIAASGMCDAGRVRHHLKRLLWRPDATVLLTGYQAAGTLGRFLQEGRRSVRIQGDDIKVAARIRTIDVYSGHADATGLAKWAKERAPRASVLLNHGEPESLQGLEIRLRDAFDAKLDISAAQLDRCYVLTPQGAEIAPADRAPRIALGAATQLDWHNARSELLGLLSERLDAAPDDSARAALIEDLISRLGREPTRAP
ncbi:MAG: MBL fold metallo-hydrolase RNA specificity domain-containing protein [Hyphomonadaceae bacterium]